MKFLADENLYAPIIHGLRDRWHEVFSILEGGKTGTLNEEIFRIAARENRVIVTMDKHFANMLCFPSDQYSGIIVASLYKIRVDKETGKNRFCSHWIKCETGCLSKSNDRSCRK